LPLAQHILLTLIQPGDGTDDTRRPATMAARFSAWHLLVDQP
jgi:hypothetical protein